MCVIKGIQRIYVLYIINNNDPSSYRFIIPSFLRNHFRRTHEGRDSRVCDVCAKFFKCSKSYETHYLVEHTNISQQVQCDICNRWLKHSDILKEHKRRHFATEATCPQCGHVSPSKKALRGHIRSAHSEAKLFCSICGKAFKWAKTLQV